MKEKKKTSDYAKYKSTTILIKPIKAPVIAIIPGKNKIIKNDTPIKSARPIEFNMKKGLGEIVMQSLIKYKLSYIKEYTLSAIKAKENLNTFNNIIIIKLKEKVEQTSKNIRSFLFYNTLATLSKKLISLIKSFLIQKNIQQPP